MEDSRKLFITALVVILGGNASNLFNGINNTSNSFDKVDGKTLEASMVDLNSKQNDRLLTLELKVIECMKRHKR